LSEREAMSIPEWCPYCRSYPISAGHDCRGLVIADGNERVQQETDAKEDRARRRFAQLAEAIADAARWDDAYRRLERGLRDGS